VALDYGVRRTSRHARTGLVVGVGVLLVIAIAASVVFNVQRGQAIAEARDWAITGPPCPTTTAAAYAANLQHAPVSFEFSGVTWAREFGHSSCAALVNGGGKGFGTFPECQFTSPDQVHVATPKGDFYFYVRGRPATVAVHDGLPSCVLAAKFGQLGGDS